MASVLTQKTTLNQTDVKSLFKEYGKFKISTNKYFYRSILQNAISELKDKENLLKLDPVRFNSVGWLSNSEFSLKGSEIFRYLF